jgi:protein phosphatase PTC2/3
MENRARNFGTGGYKGRIIFLGDGTEVLTDSDDTEMFDHSEEDRDLATQVSKNSTADANDDNGLPPRAPSPPPRGPKKQQESSEAQTDASTKETAASDPAKSTTDGEPKSESSASKD